MIVTSDIKAMSLHCVDLVVPANQANKPSIRLVTYEANSLLPHMRRSSDCNA